MGNVGHNCYRRHAVVLLALIMAHLHVYALLSQEKQTHCLEPDKVFPLMSVGKVPDSEETILSLETYGKTGNGKTGKEVVSLQCSHFLAYVSR